MVLLYIIRVAAEVAKAAAAKAAPYSAISLYAFCRIQKALMKNIYVYSRHTHHETNERETKCGAELLSYTETWSQLNIKTSISKQPKAALRFVCETIDRLVPENAQWMWKRWSCVRVLLLLLLLPLLLYNIHIYKALSTFAYVHAFCVVNNRKAYTCGIGTRYFGAHRWNFFSLSHSSILFPIRFPFVSFRLLLADCVLVHVLHLRYA